MPGGRPESLDRIIHDPEQTYLGFLVRQAAASRYVCSVCEGALLLAAAGLLDGYRATTHWAFIPYLMDNYPKTTVADGHPRFVVDRNRLTGGGISSGLDEALKLIELLTDTASSVSNGTLVEALRSRLELFCISDALRFAWRRACYRLSGT